MIIDCDADEDADDGDDDDDDDESTNESPLTGDDDNLWVAAPVEHSLQRLFLQRLRWRRRRKRGCHRSKQVSQVSSRKMFTRSTMTASRWLSRSLLQICPQMPIRRARARKCARQLARSTVTRLVQQGRVGVSPCKKDPMPKLPDILLDVTATHSEVS